MIGRSSEEVKPEGNCPSRLMSRRVTLVYRVGIWLPVLVPAGVVAPRELLDVILVPPKVFQMLAISLLYGGLPYAGLALWASWWIGGRTERDVKHLALRAPLLFAVVFAILAAAAGLLVGQPIPFLAVAILGAAFAVGLGYAYVALVLVIRRLVE
jgi:hypothetical protein